MHVIMVGNGLREGNGNIKTSSIITSLFHETILNAANATDCN